MLHWMILIPYYFFGALVLASLLAVASRLWRVVVSMERLAAVATGGSIATLAILLGSGAVAIEDLTLLPLLVLGFTSFVLAGVDAMLAPSRPLASEGEADGRRTAAPQIH
jgi:hypothetical protein